MTVKPRTKQASIEGRGRTPPAPFILSPNGGRLIATMSTTTLIIIIVVVLVLFGGGYGFSRRR